MTNSANLGKLLGIPESKRTFEDSKLLALGKCYTGLEFEAENCKNPPESDQHPQPIPSDDEEAGFWHQKKDGSLRKGGVEYILREPLFGDDLISALKWICEWGTTNNLEVNYRTGMHVHVDVRNLNSQKLTTMLVYYALFEKVIFDWVGDGREGSIFCMPLYKAEGVLDQIIKVLRAEKQLKDYAKAVDRYAAFNINSLSKFGTVEWRHLQTSFNFDRILSWINVAQGFKRYAKANPLNPRELLAEISQKGPKTIFTSIVGQKIADDMWNLESEGHVWKFGIPQAQELATLLDGSAGIAWDSVRTVLGTGSNPSWQKWVEKQKSKPESNKLPENLFSAPELLVDKELQKMAVDQLAEAIREKLKTHTVKIEI